MLYAIVVVIALLLDQTIKVWTTANIVVDTGRAKLIPGLIHLANVHNTGAAFSFLAGARWFFIILCIIFVVIVIYALAMDLLKNKTCRWAAVFVLAGAIGNCIDRIICGYVVDMFEFDFLIFKHAFPVFNMADIFITVGMIVFCVAFLTEKPTEKKEKKSNPSVAVADIRSYSDSVPEASVKSSKKVSSRNSIRHRDNFTIPTFQKHDLPNVPPMDPSDPFAEWEKRANASAPESEAVSSSTSSNTGNNPPQEKVVFTPVQITPDPNTARQQETHPVVQVPITLEEPLANLTSDVSIKPSEKEEKDEFDLDSILAEFKDL